MQLINQISIGELITIVAMLASFIGSCIKNNNAYKSDLKDLAMLLQRNIQTPSISLNHYLAELHSKGFLQSSIAINNFQDWSEELLLGPLTPNGVTKKYLQKPILEHITCLSKAKPWIHWNSSKQESELKVNLLKFLEACEKSGKGFYSMDCYSNEPRTYKEPMNQAMRSNISEFLQGVNNLKLFRQDISFLEIS